jgi:putative DNA primase/helicase
MSEQYKDVPPNVVKLATYHVEGALHEVASIAFSDDALALEFADQNLDRLRYVPIMGKWFVWDGKRWEMDTKLIARAAARDICRCAAQKCNKSKTSKLIASARTISSVERLGQCDQRIVAVVDQWDADPWLLNTPDGTIDLRTGEMKPHDPADYITKVTGVAPNFKMPTPVWDSFLKKITGGSDELEKYLQRKTGYELTGITREHALFFSYGTGANGKSTFMNAVTGCFGDYHVSAPIETLTVSNQDRHPTELARLRGARLVTSMETEEGRRWAESRIKQLTGDDPVPARFMRQDFFEYRPNFKLDISGNHKPSLRSVDEAIRRRFNLLPFAVTIPPEERDPELGGSSRASCRAFWPGPFKAVSLGKPKVSTRPRSSPKRPRLTSPPRTRSRLGLKNAASETATNSSHRPNSSPRGRRGPIAPASSSVRSAS